MLLQKLLKALFDSPDYEKIKYDTLYQLHYLPVMIDGRFGFRLGFALSSGAHIETPKQSINSPFCDCTLAQNDKKLTWRKPLPKLIVQTDSIISLTKTVLKDKYVADLGFDEYVKRMDGLEFSDYFDIMEMLEDKMTSGPVALSSVEKAKLLKVLLFFNGVPSNLVSYYNTEGKFLADWLKRNCL